MNNRELAHVWASENRNEGKGSNFFFDGPVIFSYGRHFPIARLTRDLAALGTAPGPFATRRVCLFTSRGYSTTTAKHKHLAFCAIPDTFHIFTVPNVSPIGERDHAANLAHLVAEYDAALLKASRAVKNGSWHLQQAEEFAEAARTYAQTYGLPSPILSEADAASLAKIRERSNAARRKEREQEARKKEIAMLEARERIERWRNGDNLNPHYYGAAIPTMLRLDGDMIETSRGARVPVSVAARLWAGSCECLKTKTAHYFETGAPRVGDYVLREIRADGALVIGCHTLEFSELVRMAATLGLPKYEGEH